MVIPATIISAVIAVVIGVVSAVRQYSVADHVMTGLAYLFYSAPVFVVAILLKAPTDQALRAYHGGSAGHCYASRDSTIVGRSIT